MSPYEQCLFFRLVLAEYKRILAYFYSATMQEISVFQIYTKIIHINRLILDQSPLLEYI